jgi:hypothetical protein
MAVMKIPTSMVTATALSEHVVANMGLDVKPTMGVPGILAKMSLAGFPTDFIEVDDGVEDVQIKRVEPRRTRHTPGKRMVQIRLEQQEKPGGNEPVYTNVNGSAILIPRDQTIWIDYKYYHALSNAVAHLPIQDEKLEIIGWRKVPEYPMSVFHIEGKLSAREQKAADEAEKARLAAEEAAARGEDITEDEEEYV